MTLTAVINPVVPLNLLFTHQRVIFPHSRQSAKYRIVTHNFTNDDLTDGNSPSYHHRGVTHGGPLPPTIFNVVFDAVIWYWVTLLGGSQGDNGQGLRESIKTLMVLLYANYGLAASSDIARLQGAFDVLTSLFDQVGLQTN